MEVKSVAEQLVFSTVLIEFDHPEGVGRATGFFLLYERREKQYLFIVSNKHVIKDVEHAKLLFTTASNGKPNFGDRYILGLSKFEGGWIIHPNPDVDVAILPLVPLLNHIKKESNKEVFFRALPSSLIPKSDKIAELDAIEDVIFVGYPSGIYDETNLLPIVRRGITATPIMMDYSGEKAFLIDASVFPGSSGSPVFLYNPGSYYDKRGSLVVKSRIMLVGIISKHATRDEEGRLEMQNIPNVPYPVPVIPQAIDLGLAYKSQTIVETIEEGFKRKLRA